MEKSWEEYGRKKYIAVATFHACIVYAYHELGAPDDGRNILRAQNLCIWARKIYKRLTEGDAKVPILLDDLNGLESKLDIVN